MIEISASDCIVAGMEAVRSELSGQYNYGAGQHAIERTSEFEDIQINVESKMSKSASGGGTGSCALTGDPNATNTMDIMRKRGIILASGSLCGSNLMGAQRSSGSCYKLLHNESVHDQDCHDCQHPHDNR